MDEYLLSYGVLGDFGRFRASVPLECRRGQRAVVRTHRGLELAEVLCPATAGHAHFLPNTTLGPLLRLATSQDVAAGVTAQSRAAALFTGAQLVVQALALPLEVLDAEVLLDGEQAVLHHLPWGDFDERELVSRLSREFGGRVQLHRLRQAADPGAEESEETHGCGRPGCGQTEGGGCSSCGSGGGCSTCGSATPEDVRSYFAGLRETMHRAGRVPLV